MGTPNITGKYTGQGTIVVRASDAQKFGKTQAFSLPNASTGHANWTFNFDDHTVVVEDGQLMPEPDAQPNPAVNFFVYEARAQDDHDSNVLPMVEQTEEGKEGLYTVKYHWQVIANGVIPGPAADTEITLEITKLKDGSIAFVTAVVNPDVSWIPGTPLPEPFFHGATPDWRGRALKEG